MNPEPPTALWLRVAARPAALERVLQKLRTLLQSPLAPTLARGPDGDHRLRVELGPRGGDAERIRRELISLRDVREAVLLPARGGAGGREMALVRLRVEDGDEAGLDREGVRVIGREGADVIVEVTGPAPRVESIVSGWSARGRIRDLSRTGEIVLPEWARSSAGSAA